MTQWKQKSVVSDLKPKIFRKHLEALLQNLHLPDVNSIFITGDMGCFRRWKLSRADLCEALYGALLSVFGEQVTIFVPTASMNLCNTTTPFDLLSTPSYQMGVFSEYIRNMPHHVRSEHPFWSVTAIGPGASVLKSASRHAYGVGSPWSRMIDRDTYQINFGKHPSKAVTLIHHVETVVGVPYRYNKAFLHPISEKGEIVLREYYQLVFYNCSHGLKKINLNNHYFNEMERHSMLKMSSNDGCDMYSFRMKDFFNVAVDFMIRDIYNYLENVPYEKIYRSNL